MIEWCYMHTQGKCTCTVHIWYGRIHKVTCFKAGHKLQSWLTCFEALWPNLQPLVSPLWTKSISYWPASLPIMSIWPASLLESCIEVWPASYCIFSMYRCSWVSHRRTQAVANHIQFYPCTSIVGWTYVHVANSKSIHVQYVIVSIARLFPGVLVWCL